MEEQGRNNQNGIQLDWSRLLGEEGGGGSQEEEEPLQFELVVEALPPETAAAVVEEPDDEKSIHNHEFRILTDRELRERIVSSKNTLRNTGAKLKDGGVKLKNLIKDCEDELERRRSLPFVQKDDGGCKKHIKVQRTNSTNMLNDFREGDPTALPSSKSSAFTTSFCSKMDRNEQHTLKRCDNFKKRNSWTSRGVDKRGNSSRETPVRSPGNLFVDIRKRTLSNGDERDDHFASCSPRSPEEDSPGLPANKRMSTSCVRPLRNRLSYHKGEAVVLDDEDEVDVKETTPQEDDIDESYLNTRIYFPSRHDPESIEICYTDMECLAPQGYLTSTIMNFYIRYLQSLMFPTNRERHNYHFFNTYFYEKLKEAVMKKSSMETSFAKFRRWWKGVHIFEKSYIFLPINEASHWSLVIICIPDKEDRSGLILLHLDSMECHPSKSIFNNVKRFLIEEWKFLKEIEVQLDPPMEDAIWESLPRRIQDKVLEVPQQRNDSDCGLFVLYFIKRFIEEARERLKKDESSNVLSKFGKRWFSPIEASGLRQEIRGILKQEFKNASKQAQVSN